MIQSRRLVRAQRGGCRVATLALLLALPLAAGTPLVATPQEDAPAPVLDVVDVVLVNVEVWVQDRKGRPIRGLTADDFQVFEDGEPVEITHMAEIGAPPGAAGATQPPAVEEAAADAAAAARPLEDPPHLVIYFDQMHLGPGSAQRFVKDLRRFVAERQIPASRVAILRQDFDLETEADFGSSQDDLDAALDRLAEIQPVAGGMLDARLALARMQQAWEQAQLTRSPCRIMANATRAELAARVPELSQHFAITLENLHATSRFLAGLPGVKMLVLVSDSLEVRPGADLLLFAKNVCPNERELDTVTLLGDTVTLQRALMDFTRDANANRVTFYTIQTTGLLTSSTMGPENKAFDINGLRGVDMTLRTLQRDGLVTLAHETGGEAIFNRNSFGKELASIADDMANYYSLAYVPPHAGDGRQHTIEVRVASDRIPGKATVRHRLGYRDKTSSEMLDERLEGATAFGLMDNPLEVRLAAGAVVEAGDGLYSLPLHLLLPTSRVTFLPVASGEQAQLEVQVRASDARTGEVVEVERTFRPALPPESSPMLDLQLSLQLPEGVHVVAISVRDLATGEASVVATTVAIQKPPPLDS